MRTVPHITHVPATTNGKTINEEINDEINETLLKRGIYYRPDKVIEGEFERMAKSDELNTYTDYELKQIISETKRTDDMKTDLPVYEKVIIAFMQGLAVAALVYYIWYR